MNTKKVIPCVICQEKFSERDAEELNFFPKPMVCFGCYYGMYKEDHRVWCFGKPNKVNPETGVVIRYGFDPQNSSDCKTYCPDRKVCRMFVNKTVFRYRKLIRMSTRPYPAGTSMARIFVACVIGLSKTEFHEKIEGLGEEPKEVLRVLRKRKANGISWELIEDDDKVRIRL